MYARCCKVRMVEKAVDWVLERVKSSALNGTAHKATCDWLDGTSSVVACMARRVFW